MQTKQLTQKDVLKRYKIYCKREFNSANGIYEEMRYIGLLYSMVGEKMDHSIEIKYDLVKREQIVTLFDTITGEINENIELMDYETICDELKWIAWQDYYEFANYVVEYVLNIPNIEF